MEVTGKQENQKLLAPFCIISTHKITRKIVDHVKENMLIFDFSKP